MRFSHHVEVSTHPTRQRLFVVTAFMRSFPGFSFGSPDESGHYKRVRRMSAFRAAIGIRVFAVGIPLWRLETEAGVYHELEFDRTRAGRDGFVGVGSHFRHAADADQLL